jgi:hypothetical protein
MHHVLEPPKDRIGYRRSWEDSEPSLLYHLSSSIGGELKDMSERHND